MAQAASRAGCFSSAMATPGLDTGFIFKMQLDPLLALLEGQRHRDAPFGGGLGQQGGKVVIVIAIKGHPQLKPGHRLGQIEALSFGTIPLCTRLTRSPVRVRLDAKKARPSPL